METIKKYLETMFSNMPNTHEVIRAKKELLQMMEDKYNELLNEGVAENTAIGTVISEFGNLEELSEDLGIAKAVSEIKNEEHNILPLEKVKEYINDRNRHALLQSTGIFFCIICLVFPILISYSDGKIGAVLMFCSVAVGVFFIVYSNLMMGKWEYIKKEHYSIDLGSIAWINKEKEKYRSNAALLRTIGIVFCILCIVPAIALDELSVFSDYISLEDLSGALLFLFVGIGVFLIVYSNSRFQSYNYLLNINSDAAIINNFDTENSKSKPQYQNETTATIMSVFWPTITCIYLSISFLTFCWHTTWIIWPIAALIKAIIDNSSAKKGNEVE